MRPKLKFFRIHM